MDSTPVPAQKWSRDESIIRELVATWYFRNSIPVELIDLIVSRMDEYVAHMLALGRFAGGHSAARKVLDRSKFLISISNFTEFEGSPNEVINAIQGVNAEIFPERGTVVFIQNMQALRYLLTHDRFKKIIRNVEIEFTTEYGAWIEKPSRLSILNEISTNGHYLQVVSLVDPVTMGEPLFKELTLPHITSLEYKGHAMDSDATYKFHTQYPGLKTIRIRSMLVPGDEECLDGYTELEEMELPTGVSGIPETKLRSLIESNRNLRALFCTDIIELLTIREIATLEYLKKLSFVWLAPDLLIYQETSTSKFIQMKNVTSFEFSIDGLLGQREFRPAFVFPKLEQLTVNYEENNRNHPLLIQ